MQISINHLTFGYEGSYDLIFDDASFTMDTDWRLGLIGRNGRGKTTLLRLLMGELPDDGAISAPVVFSYFPYHVTQPEQLTGKLIGEIAPDLPEWQLNRELQRLRMPAEVLSRPFQTLSNGEQTKILLAGLFLRENSFLLIDEPTNHLDQEARRNVAEYLRNKSGFILVSHDRQLLDDCVDHIVSINRANIEVRQGNFSAWWADKQAQDQLELARNEALKGDIQRLETAARRTAGWADKVEKTKGARISGVKADKGYIGHKSAKKMKQAKCLEKRQDKAIEEKSALLKNIDNADELTVRPLTYRTERLASFREVAISYDGRPVCQPVTFEICRGDRVVLSGRNGSGKSSLLKLLMGEQLDHAGVLSVGSQLKISYVPQDTSFLRGDLTQYARSLSIDETLFKTILRKLDFQRIQFEKDMADYSGGQKKKVLLAGSLCQQAHLYVWDEPLNFVDVMSRVQLEELLLACKPTLLLVEHDPVFCSRLATKTIELM